MPPPLPPLFKFIMSTGDIEQDLLATTTRRQFGMVGVDGWWLATQHKVPHTSSHTCMPTCTHAAEYSCANGRHYEVSECSAHAVSCILKHIYGVNLYYNDKHVGTYMSDV